jgi:hypothetical protein
MTLASMMPLMIAGNLARYRTPLEILFSLSAAYLVIELLYFIIRKNWKLFFIWLGVFLLSFIYTANIVSKGLFVINPNDLISMYGNHYIDKLMDLEREHKDAEYLEVTTDLMSCLPDYFFKTKLSDPIYFANEADCCKYAAQLMDSHLKTLQIFNNQPAEIAFYKDRINILQAKADNYYKNRKK